MFNSIKAVLFQERKSKVSYKNAYSVDDLVKQKEKFVDKVVVLNGVLEGYTMGPGIIHWPLRITVSGQDWKIYPSCEINRFQGDHKRLQPYFVAYLGKEIGIKIFANSRTLTAINFGGTEFLIRS